MSEYLWKLLCVRGSTWIFAFSQTFVSCSLLCVWSSQLGDLEAAKSLKLTSYLRGNHSCLQCWDNGRKVRILWWFLSCCKCFHALSLNLQAVNVDITGLFISHGVLSFYQAAALVKATVRLCGEHTSVLPDKEI